MRCAFAALGFFAACGVATANEVDAGRAIFETGVGVTARIMGMDLPGTGFACRRCHGLDGAGGREGATVMPAIGWDKLAAPVASRPAYTPELFRKALETGISPSGRALDAAMPRYRLDGAQADALMAYLMALPAIERRGIEADAVHLGVLSTPRSQALASAYAGALEQALAERIPAHGIFGRTVKVRPVGVAAGTDLKTAVERSPVVAMIGLAPADSGLIADLLGDGMPVLFPFFPLAGTEDRDLAHGLMADWPAVADAIALRIKADGRSDLILAAGDAGDGRLAALAAALTRAGVSYRLGDDLSVGMASAVLLLPRPGAADAWITRLRRDAVLYGMAEDFVALRVRLNGAGIRYRLAVQGTSVASMAATAQLGALEAHALMAADLLHGLLLSAGRDLRRATLLAGFRNLRRQAAPNLLLDYATHPGSGTAAVEFIVE